MDRRFAAGAIDGLCDGELRNTHEVFTSNILHQSRQEVGATYGKIGFGRVSHRYCSGMALHLHRRIRLLFVYDTSRRLY